MIKKNKKQLIISSIVILLPIIAGLVMWNILPERMTTHWGVYGQANGWSSKTLAIFVLPVILLVVHWLCIVITAKDPGNKNQSNKIFLMIIWIFPVVSLITNGMMYAYALGNDISMEIGVRILLGIMFVVLGNYLPKCKQNHTIGIKVTWALRNEENWNKTHRFAGRVWVLGGVLFLATLFVPMESMVYVFLVIVLLLSFLPMIYSYAYYRKQLKAGTATKGDAAATPYEKKSTKIALIFGVIVLILAGVLMFTGNFEVQFDDTSFTVDATYWGDITINYIDIDNIEYRDQDKPGERTFGYGSLSLLMGEFENSEFGRYTRYSYSKCNSCVVISVDGKILVINGKDEENTQEIYRELKKK